jgi:hypothetical protein
LGAGGEEQAEERYTKQRYAFNRSENNRFSVRAYSMCYKKKQTIHAGYLYKSFSYSLTQIKLFLLHPQALIHDYINVLKTSFALYIY